MDKVGRHRLWWFACLLLVTVGLCFVFREYLALETLIAREAWLRDAMDSRPVRTVAIAFVVYIVLSLIPGLAGKSVVFGWLLGFWKGLVVVNCGLTIAALTAFLISRHLIRDVVRDKLGWFMIRLRRRMRENDGTFLLTLRLLHAPFSVVNYAVGATDVTTRRFWWTTQLGLLPGNIAFVLAGASLPSLRELQEQGMWSIVNVPLLVGLTVVGFVPLAIRWAVHQLENFTAYNLQLVD